MNYETYMNLFFSYAAYEGIHPRLWQKSHLYDSVSFVNNSVIIIPEVMKTSPELRTSGTLMCGMPLTHGICPQQGEKVYFQHEFFLKYHMF